jgi:hypothetical protein
MSPLVPYTEKGMNFPRTPGDAVYDPSFFKRFQVAPPFHGGPFPTAEKKNWEDLLLSPFNLYYLREGLERGDLTGGWLELGEKMREGAKGMEIGGNTFQIWLELAVKRTRDTITFYEDTYPIEQVRGLGEYRIVPEWEKEITAKSPTFPYSPESEDLNDEISRQLFQVQASEARAKLRPPAVGKLLPVKGFLGPDGSIHLMGAKFVAYSVWLRDAEDD